MPYAWSLFVRSFVRHEISWKRVVFGFAAQTCSRTLTSRFANARLSHTSTTIAICCGALAHSFQRDVLLWQCITTFVTVKHWLSQRNTKISRRNTVGIVRGRLTCRDLTIETNLLPLDEAKAFERYLLSYPCRTRGWAAETLLEPASKVTQRR